MTGLTTTLKLPSLTVIGGVLEDIDNQFQVGLRHYGKPLQTCNGRDALWDAYIEQIDHLIYLKQELMERDQHARATRILGVCLMFYANGGEDHGEQAKLALEKVFGTGEDDDGQEEN